MAFRIELVFVYTILFLSLYNVNGIKLLEGQKMIRRFTSFSWQNCGPAGDPIKVKSLDVPDPIIVPGNDTFGVTFTIGASTATDISVSLDMEKKIAGFYIKVPCIDNVGSCTYGGLCADWAKFCPQYFAKFGIPCTCPIPPNTYSVPDSGFDIKGKIPSAAEGDYRVTANMVSSAGHLGCIQIQATLK